MHGLRCRREEPRGALPQSILNARIGARLRGTEITFSSFDDDGSSRLYTGRVEGGAMVGESVGQDFKTLAWRATRD